MSDGVLEALAVPAAAGRLLSAADQDPARRKDRDAQLRLLAAAFWRRPLGHGPKHRHRFGETREIVGVMPRGFRVVDQDFDVLMPFAFDRGHLNLARLRLPRASGG